jgi:GIY-YIG catalytic domain-containing protein
MTLGAGEQTLSNWMSENAFVCGLEQPTPWEIESGLICELRQPLNLAGNSPHSFD